MSVLQRNTLAIATVLSMLLMSTGVVAQDAAPGLADLQGQKDSEASRTLGARGYTMESESGGYGNWWSRSDQRCVTVRSERGRVASVVTSPAPDCGQRAGGKKDGISDGAKVAVAAAAILGIAALAHQAHHHDDGGHDDDARHEADYERGYRDAVHGYSAEADSGTYSDGYGAGLRERSKQVPWRSETGRGGQGEFADLVGARAAGAETNLRSRGFTDRDAQQRDGRSVVTWWNAQTQQCLHVSTEDGRVATVRSVGAENCR